MSMFAEPAGIFITWKLEVKSLFGQKLNLIVAESAPLIEGALDDFAGTVISSTNAALVSLHLRIQHVITTSLIFKYSFLK